MVGGWDELEKRVIYIVNKNKALQEKIEELSFENELLKQKAEKFELMLLEDSEAMKSLEEEKTVIKNSIELMLHNINSIEGA